MMNIDAGIMIIISISGRVALGTGEKLTTSDTTIRTNIPNFVASPQAALQPAVCWSF